VKPSALQENVPLAPFTTFGIGGLARYFVHAENQDTALRAVETAQTLKVPLFVLGGGSNLLVADGGFPGLILKIGIPGIDWESDKDQTVVNAGAGEDWDNLVRLCVDRELAGIECLSGIPGSVGGTPVQNVGAYGQEVADVLASVRAYDRSTQTVVDLSHADCHFSYRSSLFNTTERDRYIVLGVTYRLRRGEPATIRYADLRRFFDKSANPPLADVRKAVLEIRASKAMLLRAGDPDCRSAGSFFKNPIVSQEMFSEVEKAAGNASVPRYPATGGNVKIAAAWLIEQSGFQKGYTSGKAGLSCKHTLALINKGGGSAADVLRLAREIRSRVKDRFGVWLVPEPVFVGFDPAVSAEMGTAPGEKG
jgi:UDP-N-acetylmuramate dehydrogenase